MVAGDAGGLPRTSELGSPLLCWPCLPVCKMGVFLTHLSGVIALGAEVVDLARKRETELKRKLGRGGLLHVILKGGWKG